MNYLTFFAFGYYLVLVFIAGIGVFAIFDKKDKLMQQRSLFLGEVLLIGNVLIVGEMITFSFTHFYYGLNLWFLVSLNFLFLFRSQTRDYLKLFSPGRIGFDAGFTLFVLFLGLFTFRNCYPLIDVDSHASYLWMPKLWIQHGTSIFKDVIDVRAYWTHLESVPYALGMVLFGQDTLFESLINLMWRWIVLLLVFGYTSYRFNTFYGLAAALFVMLNDHFFYSGINTAVLLNGAVIAFIFGAVYNFWESRVQENPFRFMLAIIFLSQIFATKALMVFVVIFLTGFMLLTQKNLFSQAKVILTRRNWIIPLMIAIYFTLFWLIRTYCVTGLATFPVMAGKFHIQGWTPESDRVRMIVQGGISFPKFLKFMNYLFIWPGVNPAKIVIAMISFLPLTFLFVRNRNKADQDEITELCFWLSVSLLIMMGLVLTGFQDPRYYRYGIGVMSFASVYSIGFVFRHVFMLRHHAIIAAALILVSLVPIKIVLQGGFAYRPTLHDNVDVLLNKLHTSDIIFKIYPDAEIALKGYYENLDKSQKAAWYATFPVFQSNFILPERPHVGLWYSPMIQWDSYAKEDLIVKDLKAHGIEWVMDVRGEPKKLQYLTLEEFAKEEVHAERYPKTTLFDYGFPKELSTTGL